MHHTDLDFVEVDRILFEMGEVPLDRNYRSIQDTYYSLTVVHAHTEDTDLEVTVSLVPVPDHTFVEAVYPSAVVLSVDPSHSPYSAAEDQEDVYHHTDPVVVSA